MNFTEIPFFFIIGRPRSGTTLLRTLFDAHPNCIVPPEYPVITDIFHRFGPDKTWNRDDVQGFYNSFIQPQLFDFWKFEYLQINEENLRTNLTQIAQGTSSVDVLKLFYLHAGSDFEKEDIRLLGDKNPVYALYTKQLMRWFPEAKFIFITRDYRDNFVSMRKFEFEAPNMAIQAYRWKYISRMFHRLQKKYPGRIIHVRHEDIATHPEESLRNLCSFLSLPYNDSVLQFHKKSDAMANKTGRDVFMKYHESLTRPVNSDNVGLWKSVLNEKEIRQADFIVGKWGKMYGYEASGIKIKISDIPSSMLFQCYGYILYQMMLLGERLPYRLKVKLAGFLPSLAKFYRRFFQ